MATKKTQRPETRVKRGDRIVELKSRKNGVSIDELVAEFGNKPHTTRAQISVEVRKRGIAYKLEDGRYRVAGKTR